jgi:hypothetical protein
MRKNGFLSVIPGKETPSDAKDGYKYDTNIDAIVPVRHFEEAEKAPLETKPTPNESKPEKKPSETKPSDGTKPVDPKGQSPAGPTSRRAAP